MAPHSSSNRRPRALGSSQMPRVCNGNKHHNLQDMRLGVTTVSTDNGTHLGSLVLTWDVSHRWLGSKRPTFHLLGICSRAAAWTRTFLG